MDFVDEVNVSFEGKFDETDTCDGMSAFDETDAYDEAVKFDERNKFELDCSPEGKLDGTSEVEFDCSLKDVFNASSVSLASS